MCIDIFQDIFPPFVFMRPRIHRNKKNDNIRLKSQRACFMSIPETLLAPAGAVSSGRTRGSGVTGRAAHPALRGSVSLNPAGRFAAAKSISCRAQKPPRWMKMMWITIKLHVRQGCSGSV